MTNTNRPNNYALLLDSGNTRLKVSVFDIDNKALLDKVFALEHKNINIKTVQELLEKFSLGTNKNDSKRDMTRINFIQIIGVNVAGTTKAGHIDSVFFDITNIKTHWIAVTHNQANVFNHYENINRLGVDRWLSMVGLSKISTHKRQPCVLASFGTATTIDTLVPHEIFLNNYKNNHSIKTQDLKFQHNTQPNLNNIDWHFVGGTILPGPSLMAQSLETNTANLPHAVGETQSFPLETYQAISSGIAGAQAGAVIRQWQAALDTFKVEPILYISGGGANIVKDELELAIKKAQELNCFKPCAPIELNAPVMHGLATFLFD